MCLSSQELRPLNQRINVFEPEIKNMNFYFLHSGNYGVQLKDECTEPDYTGNDYDTGATDEINYTYLSRALIIKYKHTAQEIISSNIQDVPLMDVQNITTEVFKYAEDESPDVVYKNGLWYPMNDDEVSIN